MSTSCLNVAGSKLAASAELDSESQLAEIAEMETEPQLEAIAEMVTEPHLAANADLVTEPQLMDCAGQATARYSCVSEDIHSQIYKSDVLHTLSSYVLYPRFVAVLSPPLALISSCIEAMAFSFTLEELNLILEQSTNESHRESLALLMRALIVKAPSLPPYS